MSKEAHAVDRDAIIEECAKWHDAQVDRIHRTTLWYEHGKSPPPLVQWHRDAASAIRSLKSAASALSALAAENEKLNGTVGEFLEVYRHHFGVEGKTDHDLARAFEEVILRTSPARLSKGGVNV